MTSRQAQVVLILSMAALHTIKKEHLMVQDKRTPKILLGKREDPKPGPKKPKEKVDALSQFDLNNYASVVIIDDHPEVTVVEDPQSNLNDDGFTEVVSKKQQKRLQDEERRKKEEQIIQVWNKKNANEKGRNQTSKLPPRFAKNRLQEPSKYSLQLQL